MKIQEQLFNLQDQAYRDFISALMPTLDKGTILGVRTPQLRSLAKELYHTNDATKFLRTLPHAYFEENQLHIFLIEQEKNAEQCFYLTEEFLPHIDNWATCDQFLPRALVKDKNALLTHIKRWLTSNHIYTVRFGLNMLMRYFLNANFQPEYLDWAAAADSDEYYLKMMVAWFFATALAKQYDTALPYLQQRRLSDWTHRKAIQKAIESRRIPPQQKDYLRTLKKQS